ncbi:MAG: helix-turn-helix domain-containing protein [Cyanobacteria bacterium P01_D01_bin.6]
MRIQKIHAFSSVAKGEIALKCGFNSHSHLGRKFRRLTGIIPKAYRAQ